MPTRSQRVMLIRVELSSWTGMHVFWKLDFVILYLTEDLSDIHTACDPSGVATWPSRLILHSRGCIS